MSKKIVVLFFSLIILLLSCNTTEPPLPPPPDETIKNTITLKIEWTDLYRVKLSWNRSSIDTPGYGMMYDLIRSSQAIGSFTLTGADTSYIDGQTDSLEQGTSYDYKIVGYSSTGKLRDTSKTVIAKTLTATSHDITWDIDTLGQPGNFLYDVWGTDENNVWAVGGINLPEGGTTIIKWDGVKWNYHSFPDGSAYSIWGFYEMDIWIAGEWANRGFLGHFDGSGWTEYKSNYFYSKGDTVYALRAVWGSAPDDVWAVGNQGTIIHWDGSEWKKRNEIGDELIIFYDIWGSSANNIYAITGSLTNRSQLWHYDGNLWMNVSDNIPGFKKNLYSLWIDKNNTGFIGGNTILKLNNGFIEDANIALQKVIMIVRGMSSADIIFGGQRGTVFHYNGTYFKEYPELRAYEGPLNEILGAQVFTNKIFLVGYSDKALVYIGTK